MYFNSLPFLVNMPIILFVLFCDHLIIIIIIGLYYLYKNCYYKSKWDNHILIPKLQALLYVCTIMQMQYLYVQCQILKYNFVNGFLANLILCENGDIKELRRKKWWSQQ